MAIHVTPIPRLTVLTTPAFTLGTSNAAGSAATAVASNSTLLAFDAVAPQPVASLAVVGSSTVSSRRDHVHAGTTATGTVVDQAITRFDGTGGASLQGYSSLSPTITDAGVINLTSGQLVFPATQAASSGANTLDDYEIGTFNPTVMDNDLDPDMNQTYSSRSGRYIKIGDLVTFQLVVILSAFGDLTTSQQCRVGGLPIPSNSSNPISTYVVWGESVTITAGVTISCRHTTNTAYIGMTANDSGTGTTDFLLSELTSNGQLFITGSYAA
jgi:hypothetical protein